MVVIVAIIIATIVTITITNNNNKNKNNSKNNKNQTENENNNNKSYVIYVLQKSCSWQPLLGRLGESCWAVHAECCMHQKGCSWVCWCQARMAVFEGACNELSLLMKHSPGNRVPVANFWNDRLSRPLHSSESMLE